MNDLNEIENLNDLVIAIFAEKKRVGLNKELLIREAFCLWYILIEGESCHDFSPGQIQEYLFENYNNFRKDFSDDAECCFIIGWMIGISFWNFDSHLDEKDGYDLLFKAYRHQPANSLFKWVIKDELALKEHDVIQLEVDIVSNFYNYFNHGNLIKNYFIDII